MKAFIDTSAFCALAIPKDRNNQKAKSFHADIQKRRAAVFTSDYVLDETYTLLRVRGSHLASVKFMDQISKSHINIIRITEDIETSAKKIFKKFEDRRLSFTDCTSFALINQLVIEIVFSFDEHFRYHPYPHHIEYLG